MKKIFGFILVIATFSSCQKVIDVDLNEENSEIVIDANYSAKDSTVHVLITTTSSFFDSTIPPTVDDAIVSITDENGTVTSVPFIGDGVYKLTNYIPQYGTTYTLNVAANGVNYTAESTMNDTVQLDAITYEYVPSFFGNADGYIVYMNFQDPTVEGDYYEVVLSRNGVIIDGVSNIITQDDVLTNGNYIERPLFIGELYNLSDIAGMELRKITKERYNYINELDAVAAQNSGAPGNPKSNWDNNALGFFSAYSSSFQEVLIQ